MIDTMRTAGGAAPLSVLPPAAGTQAPRALAVHLRHAVLHGPLPPQQAGISALQWKMATPQHRAQLLRQLHFKSVFHRRVNLSSVLRAVSPGATSGVAPAAGQAQVGAPKSLGLWRHHGFFHLGHRPEGALARALHRLHAPSHGGWMQRMMHAVPAHAAASASAPSAAAAQGAGSPQESAALAKVTQEFQARFAQTAQDPAAFNALLKKAFGDHFDATKAEAIRQQSLAGDFSWMPKIKLADASQMRDLSGAQGQGEAMGCYVKSEDTVLINRDLLARDPAQAEKVLAEEVGHALDARLNTSDAAGDEGDIFSRLVHGETLSAGQLAEMKADNDHGVIELNGKKTDVEYSWLSKAWKSVTNCVKRVVKAVTNCIKNTLKAMSNVVIGLATFDFNRVQQGMTQAWDAVKDAAKEIKDAVKESLKEIRKIVKDALIKLMQNKYFNIILTICSYIPIAPLQLAVRVIQVVKAAYMLYQGIKNKSWSMALSAVASMATAGSGLAKVAGLDALAGTLNTVGTYAGAASQAYNAAASKNYAQALAIGAAAFGAPKGVTSALETAAKVETAVHAIEDHNYGAALAAGASALGVKGEAKGIINDVRHAEAAFRAYRNHDYAGMAVQAGEAAHVGGETLAVLNTVRNVDRAVHAFEDKHYAQAVSDLKQAGQGWVDFGTEAPKDKKPEEETIFDHVKHAGAAAMKGDWGTVIDQAGQALKVEGKTKEYFDRAKAIDAGIHEFEDGKYEAGAAKVGQGLGFSAGQQETVQDLVHVKRADDAQRKGDNQKALDEIGAAFHGTGGVQPWLDRAKVVDEGVHEFEDGKYEEGARKVGQGLGFSAGQQETVQDLVHVKRADDAQRKGDNQKALDEIGAAFHGTGGVQPWLDRAKVIDEGVHEFEDGKYEAGARKAGEGLGLSEGQQETVQDMVLLKRAEQSHRGKDNGKAIDQTAEALHVSGFALEWFNQAKQADAAVHEFEDGHRAKGATALGQALGLPAGAQALLDDGARLKGAEDAYRKGDRQEARATLKEVVRGWFSGGKSSQPA